MKNLDEILQTRGGVLTAGMHGDCATGVCAMEARALLMGLPPTDDPDHSPRDAWARVLNDAPWSSDVARTEAMREVVIRNEPSAGWVERIVIATVTEVISRLPALSETLAQKCRAAHTLAEVALAAMAVRVAAGAMARAAADEAEVAVRAVAWAAARTADEVKNAAQAVAWAADEAEDAARAAVRAAAWAVARPAARAAEDTEAARAAARAVVWAAVRAANELPDAVLGHAIRIALETWNSA